MPDQPDFAGYFQAYLDRGLTPQQAIQALEGVSPAGQAAAQNWLKQQNTPSTAAGSVARELGIAGSGALQGLENTVWGLPAAGVNLAAHELGYAPPVNPLAAQALTNRLGLTNRPDLTPQGSGERMLAAGARGVGGAVPFLAMGPLAGVPAALTLGSGAAGGAVGEGVQELTGSPTLGSIAGMVAGGAAGLGATALRPGAQALMDRVVDSLGGPETQVTAGQSVQAALQRQNALAFVGQGNPSSIPTKDLTKMLAMKPDRLARTLYNDPATLQILRSEVPDAVDDLAASKIGWQGVSGWKGLQPESKSALIPDPDDRNMMEQAVQLNAPPGGLARSSEPLITAGLGSLAGIAAQHLGLLPFGESAAMELGGLAALSASRAISNHIAKNILQPWVMGASGAGAAGGNAGAQSMGFTIPPQPGLQ